MLSKDLKNYLESRPIKAKPIGGIGRLGKWIGRQPVLASSVTGLVLVTIIASILIYISVVETLVNSAVRLQGRGFFQEAERKYKDALSLALTWPFMKTVRVKALAGLGAMYSRTESSKELLEKALKYYNESISIDPNNYVTLNDLAHTYESRGNYAEAIKCYQRMLDVSKPPQSVLAIWNYAGLLRRLGRTEEALEFLGKHYKEVRTDPLVKGEVGSVLDSLIKSSAYKLRPITTYDQIRQILAQYGFDAEYIEDFIKSYRGTHPWFDEPDFATLHSST